MFFNSANSSSLPFTAPASGGLYAISVTLSLVKSWVVVKVASVAALHVGH